MDPNETYKQLMDLVQRYYRLDSETGDCTRVACMFVEAFEALDSWIKSGGFLPTPWQKKKESGGWSKDVQKYLREHKLELTVYYSDYPDADHWRAVIRSTDGMHNYSAGAGTVEGAIACAVAMSKGE